MRKWIAALLVCVGVLCGGNAALASCVGSAGLVFNCTVGAAPTINDLVLGGFVLSGGATGLGTVAALDTNANDRTGYAIAGAIVGAVAVVDVEVDDRHALDPEALLHGACSDGDVVEDAEA